MQNIKCKLNWFKQFFASTISSWFMYYNVVWRNIIFNVCHNRNNHFYFLAIHNILLSTYIKSNCAWIPFYFKVSISVVPFFGINRVIFLLMLPMIFMLSILFVVFIIFLQFWKTYSKANLSKKTSYYMLKWLLLAISYNFVSDDT